MTSAAPLLPPGTGSLPPVGRPPTARPIAAGETGGSGRAREPEPALPGRTAIGGDSTSQQTGQQQGPARPGEAAPLQPGRPLLGGGPFTLAVAFGLQAEQQAAPQTAGTAGSAAEAAEVAAQAAAEEEQGTGPNQLTEEEQQVVRELQQRDREVRQHEAAHAAVGGQYAGAPQYTYQRGPDGRQYAVGGSVSIDTSPVDGDPEATLQKARQIRAAALAPAEPSAQDRAVAASAAALERQARAEIAAERAAELEGAVDAATGSRNEAAPEIETIDATPAINTAAGAEPGGDTDGGNTDGGDGTASGPGALPSLDTQADDGQSPFDLAAFGPPRAPSGFDGRTPPPQIISITV